MEKLPTFAYHYFLDEAGDTTFYGKGKTPIIGNEGVSGCFILGLLKLNEPLDAIRQRIITLQNEIASDPYYNKILSILKKKASHGYYLHAKDDVPEVRKTAFELIRSIDCSFEAVVARKIYYLYEHKHNGNEAEFYADLLSHLLKNKFRKNDRVVLNIAERKRCTTFNNLQRGLNKAMAHSASRYPDKTNNCKIVFNVQQPTVEPLLNGETRYYDFVSNKISVVWDIYDFAGYNNGQNYYSKKRKLAEVNCINEKSPKMH